MTERHAERRLVKHRLVGSCGSVAGSQPRFSPAVSFELGGRGGFIAAIRRLPQLDLQLATPPYSNGIVPGLKEVMKNVVTVVNFIKASATNEALCFETDSLYKDCVYYTETR
ncbi:hypothetical protein T07_482 [Trichinella nelsoni]|uniref:Uncharacterized protein n=1 Tax=Trichinella nelsoni TaxID=6336 RepID=A0A0V0S9D8_9BILA|nr:hypothetical protein T07_482 [Trichinella nelsoni]